MCSDVICMRSQNETMQVGFGTPATLVITPAGSLTYTVRQRKASFRAAKLVTDQHARFNRSVDARSGS